MTNMNIDVGVAGYFTLKATSTKTGKERVLAEFPNLILDVGLERMGTGTYLTTCRVGGGNTPPSVTQTALASPIASTNTIQANIIGAQASAPFYGWRRITFRFAAGVAAGNLSEVGVGWGNITTDTNLYSRALILDNLGVPTTINVLPDEVLDVVYELRIYPPTTDTTITGLNLGLSSHTVTVRASNVTASSSWGIGLGEAVLAIRGSGATLHNGTIGAITASPSGTSANVPIVNAAYAPNSKERIGTLTAGLNEANLAGGVTAASMLSSLGGFQFGFSPAIPKDNTRVLKLDIKVNWSRYVA